jgi:hypothetical protein
MAGTSTKTKVVGVRLPLDLLDWIETQGETKDVVIRALTALKDGVTGDGPDQRPVVLQTMVANLEAENARLTTERDKWRKLAQAAMPMAERKPEKGSGKLVADVLPVAGSQFPEQETWWQKQQRTNARKALKSAD